MSDPTQGCDANTMSGNSLRMKVAMIGGKSQRREKSQMWVTYQTQRVSSRKVIWARAGRDRRDEEERFEEASGGV